MTDPFRILALDGGGIRGIFPAAVLSQAVETYPSLIDEINLICGTSTGGIIALGLADQKSPEEMLRFYRDEGAAVFESPRRVRRLWGPKYDRRNLDRLLQREFGADRVLNDLSKPVCITSYELVAGTTRVLKDDHSPGLDWGGSRKIWQVAAATSSAPTYFAPVQLDAQDSHVDGGIWANNPALTGIVEAVRYFNRDLTDIRVLSIGTASKHFRVSSHERANRTGCVGWARRATDLLQGTVSVGTHYQAKLMLPNGNYLRIDDVQSEAVPLDSVKEAAPLQERGQQAARTHKAELGAFLAP